MSVQQKKRKRPRAKDWPPTSAQKKNLVPYGSRPWKLPRLNEAPYVDIWLKIISYIKQENVTRFRKFRYFRDLHNQLNGTTWTLRETPHRTPLYIKKIIPTNYCVPKLCVISDEFQQVPRGTLFILKWIPYHNNAKSECLVWVCQWADSIAPVINVLTHQSKIIFRYTDICAWESAITDRLRKYTWKRKKERKYYFDKRWKKGCLERMIRTAPKALNRGAAAIRVGILLEKYFPSSDDPAADERSVKKL